MPKAYVVGQVNFTNTVAYKEEYAVKVPGTIEKYGGKYIIRGGKMTHIEGNLERERVVVIEFPDHKAATTWYNSPEYQAIIGGRQRNAETILTIIQGI